MSSVITREYAYYYSLVVPYLQAIEKVGSLTADVREGLDSSSVGEEPPGLLHVHGYDSHEQECSIEQSSMDVWLLPPVDSDTETWVAGEVAGRRCSASDGTSASDASTRCASSCRFHSSGVNGDGYCDGIA